MSIKSDLKHSLHQILNRHKTGSENTRDDRRKILLLFVEALSSKSLNFGIRKLENLKEKHIRGVTQSWQKEGLSNGTLKNRLSCIRHLAKLLNKPNIVPSNDNLGIEKRKYVATENKALFNPDFSVIKNPYIRVSLELQRVFGLRREEALKIKPFLADKENYLQLQPTWCKGGRPRIILIRTDEQRFWLEEAKHVAADPANSLIPSCTSYKRHRDVYDKQTQRAGLRNLHGLRHAYAQQRYEELTGWKSPIAGGPTAKELSKIEKRQDRFSRMIISTELGHGRIGIVKNYLA